MSSWLELDQYKKKIESFSDTIGINLSKHGSISDEETIRDTAIAQPLIVGASLASASLLDLSSVYGVAGHSVGEVAAAALAGIVTETESMQLVNIRAQSMARAAATGETTSMAAVLGGEIETVLARLNELGLSAANYNGAGQIVAAGLKTAIDALVSEGPLGSRVIPLSVAGAFHTNYMRPALADLEEFTNTLELKDPSLKLWSNQQGQEVSNGKDFLGLLVGQVANSVRWDLCMDAMVSSGVTAVLELSPAGTLAGLAKRGMPGVEVLALKEPKDLVAAQDLINRSTGKA
jgi:[acyl-carrier-protein] S-malonyltransferase